MSDYYYLNKDPGSNPILGDEYISALYMIAKKHGINITDGMVLNEVWEKKHKIDRKLPASLKVIPIKKPRMINIRGK